MEILNSEDTFEDNKNESFLFFKLSRHYKPTLVINTEDRQTDHWVKLESPDPYINGNFISETLWKRWHYRAAEWEEWSSKSMVLGQLDIPKAGEEGGKKIPHTKHKT